MHTDIHASGFLFQKTPVAWHPYIKIARLDRPVGIWLLLLPGWWTLALAHGRPVHFALFAIGAILMRAAGCIVNDLWDRDLDARVARTAIRPLPSGEITARQAIVLLCCLLLCSFVILLQFNMIAILLGAMSLALVAVYPLMKRFTWWPQLFLGFTFNWGILMGWSAATGSLLSPIPFLIYVGGVFWTLAYDTIYAHQDKEDDAIAAIKSTALLFRDKSKKYVAVFFAVAVVFMAIAKYMASDVLPILFLMPATHAFWQCKHWHTHDPGSSLYMFKSNVIFGWLALVAFAM